MTLAVGVLYFARDLLIPLALALLLSFLLTPPVSWLEKLRLGRIASVVLVLVLAFSIAGAIVWLGMTQLADIVKMAPQYQDNLHRKIQAMRSPAGSALTKALASIQRLGGEITSVDLPASPPPNAPARTRKITPPDRGPLRVEVVSRPSGLLGSLSYVGSSLAHLLGVSAAVLIFTLFMLIQRGDLRNRFIQLVGTGHLNVMTTALDDTAHGISRYLFMQFVVNTAFGALLGLALFWIGVPNAPFWGVLGAILRFIPYVGTLVAGFCPLIVAVAVFDGWAKPLLTLALFASIELIMSAAVEPWLYGTHTGISSLAILVSTAFWTLLWGPVGLLLSTPLTVCLLVMGRYVPALQFLRVVLGEKVELPLEACYYQRLLAMDDDEAQEIAENYLKERSIGELFDLVLIPALALAEQDRHQNALGEEREKFIYQSTKLLIEDLAEGAATADIAAASTMDSALVCIPARDEADELVGLMLELVLRQAGCSIKAINLGARNAMLQTLEVHHADILLISALPPFALMQARSLCRRARRRFPHLKIILGLWGSSLETDKLQERIGLDCFDSIITNLRQAESQLPLSANLAQQQTSALDSDPLLANLS
jgi:predicted PurR-regulated permease PerM